MSDPLAATLNELASNVIGLGIDTVRVERIDKMIDQYGDRFIDRVFTENEKAYCRTYTESSERFAGRWAAKEAILKSLGVGFSLGVCWKEIEVDAGTDGAPTVRLTGMAEQICLQRGASEVLASISHCSGYCVANAFAVRKSIETARDA
ncbi:MAG: holo-ACP synthase [Planctomycetota bacterium]